MAPFKMAHKRAYNIYHNDPGAKLPSGALVLRREGSFQQRSGAVQNSTHDSIMRTFGAELSSDALVTWEEGVLLRKAALKKR